MLLQCQQLGQGVHTLHCSERAGVLQQGQALGDVTEDLRRGLRVFREGESGPACSRRGKDLRVMRKACRREGGEG